jgi:hypothetical protein
MDSGELQGFFQQVFFPAKTFKTTSLVVFSREDNRRAGSSGPTIWSHPSPSNRNQQPAIRTHPQPQRPKTS